MSSVAAMSQSLPPGDEDLAQLYHQVLAGFADESPTSEQSLHSIPPHAHGDRELESIYGQYQDGEATPTANRLQPSARSVTASHHSHYGLPSSPRPPPSTSLPPTPAPPTPTSNPQSPSQRAPRPLPRIPTASAAPVPPPPPPPIMYGAMPEPRPYHQDDRASSRPKHSSSEAGRRLPPTPGEYAASSVSNGYHGVVNPPPNSAMLGRLPSLNGYSESRPGSSGTRPGSSDSSYRAQYSMPIPETGDAYTWRPPAATAANDLRRPPPGALPPQMVILSAVI
ncbi:hypothetical protein OH77DRAFT_1249966 [Trametes cingulata]|nr:hypothetical protein OH77DRAFT_1249966 [Trametes cingulata]